MGGMCEEGREREGREGGPVAECAYNLPAIWLRLFLPAPSSILDARLDSRRAALQQREDRE